MTQKVVVVALPLGRVGSSAMMGLLEIAGLNVGRPTRLIGPSPMNPKGFFELRSQEQFLRDVYEGFYPDVVSPPTISVLEEIGEEHYLKYLNLLRREFAGFPIGIKSPRHLTLPFFHRLGEKFDIRVLVMERNRDDQIDSIMRVWQRPNINDPIKKSATRDFVRQFLEEWTEFGAEVRENYRFPYYRVSFDTLINNPIEEMKDITKFLGINGPSDQEIEDWIDRSLVNRSSLSGASLKTKCLRKMRKVLCFLSRFYRWDL